MISTRQLSERDKLALEYAACQEVPAYFLSQYAQIGDPQGGVLPFALWPFQRDLLETFETKQRVIVLKARQLGVSWLVAGYALWSALFHDGANVLMLSKRQDEATGLLDKAAYIYDRLPPYLQAKLGKANETVLQFKRRGSKITALPSTEDAGRSESASLVIVAEAAFHPHAEVNYAAYKPTVDAGGKLLLVSTANGIGNFYHRLWAEAPGNGFTPVFLRWSLRPGRDAEWWARQQQEYAATPHLLPQEYPDNPTEAFVSTGNCLFDTRAITELAALARPPIEQRDNGAVRIWHQPEQGHRYVAGADVAEGKDAGNDRLDYSHLAIYDWATCEHVASLHGQWMPGVFAERLAALCADYGYPLLGVERNNHGHAALLRLDDLGYPRLFGSVAPLAAQDREAYGKPAPARQTGWLTTAKSKPLLEQEIARLIGTRELLSHDAAFWDECLSYVQHGDRTTGAQASCHDDRVIAHGIALMMRHVPIETGKRPTVDVHVHPPEERRDEPALLKRLKKEQEQERQRELAKKLGLEE